MATCPRRCADGTGHEPGPGDPLNKSPRPSHPRNGRMTALPFAVNSAAIDSKCRLVLHPVPWRAGSRDLFRGSLGPSSQTPDAPARRSACMSRLPGLFRGRRTATSSIGDKGAFPRACPCMSEPGVWGSRFRRLGRIVYWKSVTVCFVRACIFLMYSPFMGVVAMDVR